MAQTLILTAVQAFLMVTGAILISTQATSVRASNLMASFIVIPMALLIQGESVMLFWGNNQGLWLAVAGVSVLALLLARVGVAHFQREALLGREIDVLNIRWIIQTFWRAFKGNAKSIPAWFRAEVWGTLRKQAVSIWMTIGLGVVAALGGYIWVAMNAQSVIAAFQIGDLAGLLNVGTGVPPANIEISFPLIWGHNFHAVFVIFLLGLFTFGVLGTLAYLLNTAVIGAVLALKGALGVSPLTVFIFGSSARHF